MGGGGNCRLLHVRRVRDDPGLLREHLRDESIHGFRCPGFATTCGWLRGPDYRSLVGQHAYALGAAAALFAGLGVDGRVLDHGDMVDVADMERVGAIFLGADGKHAAVSVLGSILNESPGLGL